MAYKGYEEARKEGRDRHFCHSKFLSQNTLRMIADLKSQFFDLLTDIGFVSRTDQGPTSGKRAASSQNKGALSAFPYLLVVQVLLIIGLPDRIQLQL